MITVDFYDEHRWCNFTVTCICANPASHYYDERLDCCNRSKVKPINFRSLIQYLCVRNKPISKEIYAIAFHYGRNFPEFEKLPKERCDMNRDELLIMYVTSSGFNPNRITDSWFIPEKEKIAESIIRRLNDTEVEFDQDFLWLIFEYAAKMP